jgi:probable rRNA maturation factor
MTTDTIIEDARWDAANLDALADRATEATLTHLGLDPEAFEICLMGCDDARIAELNADFRGKPQPTNVLSWPSEERAADAPGQTPPLPEPDPTGMPNELGDIAIAYETCTQEAHEAGKSMADHVTHLIIHGTLHLLGYDHIEDTDAALMEGLEVKILGKLGISDPYEG